MEGLTVKIRNKTILPNLCYICLNKILNFDLDSEFNIKVRISEYVEILNLI